jgi:uncharacterized protein (UPF0548 family)
MNIGKWEKTYENFQEEIMHWAKMNNIKVQVFQDRNRIALIDMGLDADLLLCRTYADGKQKVEVKIGKEENGFEHAYNVDLSKRGFVRMAMAAIELRRRHRETVMQ